MGFQPVLPEPIPHRYAMQFLQVYLCGYNIVLLHLFTGRIVLLPIDNLPGIHIQDLGGKSAA